MRDRGGGPPQPKARTGARALTLCDARASRHVHCAAQRASGPQGSTGHACASSSEVRALPHIDVGCASVSRQQPIGLAACDWRPNSRTCPTCNHPPLMYVMHACPGGKASHSRPRLPAPPTTPLAGAHLPWQKSWRPSLALPPSGTPCLGRCWRRCCCQALRPLCSAPCGRSWRRWGPCACV